MSGVDNDLDLDNEVSVLNRALDVSATENRRLIDENVRLRAEHKEWLAANAPGGWIDELRQHAKMAVAYKQENARLEAELAALRRQEPVVWMQSNHLHSFVHGLCGSQSAMVHCSDHQLHPDFQPLYAAPVAQPAVSVPDGWKLVPVEPTPRMQEAFDGAPFNEDIDVEFCLAYHAMLAAAPEAKP